MVKYFYLHIKDDEKGGVAYVESDMLVFEIIPEIGYNTSFPYDFILREGGFQDLQADDLGVNLMSIELKEIISKHEGDNKKLTWVKAIVKAEMNAEYFIPRYSTPLDVLNKDKTKIVGDMIIKAHLSSGKLGDSNFFPIPKEPFDFAIGGTYVVSEKLKNEIESKGMTGISFSSIPVS